MLVSLTTLSFSSSVLQESQSHDYGLFALDNIEGDYKGILMEGSFHDYDSVEETTDIVEKDGLPRYPVCPIDKLRRICTEYESLRGGACMYPKLDRRSLWFYVNSASCASESVPLNPNVKPSFPFAERDLRVDDDVFELLKQPSTSVILGVVGLVKRFRRCAINTRSRRQ